LVHKTRDATVIEGLAPRRIVAPPAAMHGTGIRLDQDDRARWLAKKASEGYSCAMKKGPV
jgi:hypothetical protein